MLYRRGVMANVRNTERGTEIDFITQLFTSSDYKEESIISEGITSLLIIKKRGLKQEEEQKQTLPEIRKIDLRIKENTGRSYAASSGDYNPWHLYGATAKLFGFRKAIAHGMWSLSKSLALLQGPFLENGTTLV